MDWIIFIKRDDRQQEQEEKQEEQETVVSSPTQYEAATKMERIDSRQSTAEYVLTYRYNLDAALSILPNLQTGLGKAFFLTSRTRGMKWVK